MKTIHLAAAAALALAPMAAGAVATTLDKAAYDAAGCVGAAGCVIDGGGGTVATLTALPQTGDADTALFSEQNYGGVRGLGVDFTTGAGAEPEIQFSTKPERVRIEFNLPQTISEITLAHFYYDGFFSGGDEPDETAIIRAFSGAISQTQTPTRTGDTDFTVGYTGVGTPTVAAINQGGSNPYRGGLVSLTGLFGDLAGITKLEFEAGAPLNASDTSDYSIDKVVSVVPAPFGALLIGSAFLVAGALRRRGRTAA